MTQPTHDRFWHIRRRFRLALAGYIILAVGTVAGLFVAYHEIHNINRNSGALSILVVCDLPPKIAAQSFANTDGCPELLDSIYQQYAPIESRLRPR